MNKCLFLIVLIFSTHLLADGIAEEIKENVRDNWEDISEWCEEVMALKEKLPSLPENAWFSTDKQDQRKEIRELQSRIRDLLLTSDSRGLLSDIEEVDEELSELREELEKLREEKAFYPKRKEKIERKLDELEEEKGGLEAKRAREVGKIRNELESIGLKFKGDSINNFISLVNRKDFIDNMIVARVVYDIVENLRAAVSDGNICSATRYYGIYVVLMDVQISCYEAYLNKSRHGEWAQRLGGLVTGAEKTIEKCQTNIVCGLYSAADCESFRKMQFENKKLLTAISVYKDLLGRYERGVEERLEKARLRREKAQCAFETSANVMSFATLVFEAQSDYTTLMEVDLPELKDYSSSVLDEQIRSITIMLDTGE